MQRMHSLAVAAGYRRIRENRVRSVLMARACVVGRRSALRTVTSALVAVYDGMPSALGTSTMVGGIPSSRYVGRVPSPVEIGGMLSALSRTASALAENTIGTVVRIPSALGILTSGLVFVEKRISVSETECARC